MARATFASISRVLCSRIIVCALGALHDLTFSAPVITQNVWRQHVRCQGPRSSLGDEQELEPRLGGLTLLCVPMADGTGRLLVFAIRDVVRAISPDTVP